MRPQEFFHLIGEVRDGNDLALPRADDSGLVALHWTDRDAFLARLARDYPGGCALTSHGGLSLFGVRVVEENSIRPGFAQVSDAQGIPWPITIALSGAAVRR